MDGEEGKDQTVNEDGTITYNLKPHDTVMVVKWEFDFEKQSSKEEEK